MNERISKRFGETQQPGRQHIAVHTVLNSGPTHSSVWAYSSGLLCAVVGNLKQPDRNLGKASLEKMLRGWRT